MTLKIGRCSLRSPHDVRRRRSLGVDAGLDITGLENPGGTTIGAAGYALRGTEVGAGAEATMSDFDRECARLGAKYCSDDGAVPAIPSGYYTLADPEDDKPRGAPRLRPWSLLAWATDRPNAVVRQAESDNVAGADTADATADEGYHVAYVPTIADVVVLQPGAVAGAEPLNLPAGNYRATLRCWQVGFSSALLRIGIRTGADVLIADSAQVAIGAADQWVELNLGTFTVPQANDRSNWYSVKVQGIAAQLGQVRLDRLVIRPTV